jgi:peptidyl-prolyl cis-trans isomerase D
MAIIGKIRDNSVLVVAVVGISLALFIVGDWLTNRGTGRGAEDTVGEIYGKNISATTYEKRVQEAIERQKQQYQQAGMEMDDNMRDQVREQVWNQMIMEQMMDKIFSNVPLSVSVDELNDMVYGTNIHSYVKQVPIFQDMMGNFSVDSVKNYLTRLEQSPNPEARQQWIQFENDLKKDRKWNKYLTMLTKGVHTTNFEAKNDYLESSRRYNVRYVLKKYSEIPDSTITLNEEELKAYYEKHKKRKQYEQMGSRVIEYVEFSIIPTQADIEYAKSYIQNLVEPFKNSDNDSAFVMEHAESKNFMDNWINPNEFTPEADSLIQQAQKGDVVGPFKQFEYFKIIKIRDIKFEPEVKARHILWRTEGTDKAKVKKQVDSVVNVIKRKNNFEEMAAKFGTDGTKDKGGDLGWYSKGMMVKEFEEATFNGKINQVTTVETQFGIHIIEVTDKRDVKRIKTATVDYKIKPLQSTIDLAREKATEFYNAIPDGSKFEETAKKFNLNVFENEVYNSSKTLNGMPDSKEVVRWLYSAQKNDVSDIFTLNEKLIIAHVKTIKEKGIPAFEDVRAIMEIPARNEKKAKMLIEKMQNFSTLDDLSKNIEAPVMESGLSFASTSILGGGGDEPEVIGTVFSLSSKHKGALTKPIKGRLGVYVLQLQDVVEPEPKDDYSTNKDNLQNKAKTGVSGEAYRAMRDKANIIDKRPFY